MDTEIPDSVKRTMNIQQEFMKKNKDVFDTVNRHNDYLQSFYDKSNIQYINSMTSKYDSYIKTVGKYVYLTDSLAYNFYKPDYYESVRNNIYNIDKYIPNYAKTDFRFQVQTQKLMSQVELLNKKFNNISNPEINEFEIKFDKLISESLVDTTDNNKNVEGDTDIRRMIAEIHEAQKRQEKAFHEEIENRKQSNPSNEPVDKNFDIIQSFLMPLFAFLGVITVPKEAYEAIVWYVQIISDLINTLF